jgi:threonine aldolase
MSDGNSIVNLYQARPVVDPSQVLAEIARKCETGINADVYGDFSSSKDSSYLRSFEAEVASFLGFEDAIFLVSGVMAQNIVLAMCRDKTSRGSFLCHYSSHLLLHENDSYKHLLGMKAVVVQADENSVDQQPMSSSSIRAALDASATVDSSGSSAPQDTVGVAVLEAPHREIGGKCTPIDEIKEISDHLRSRGIHFHMDGARLWEASAHYCNEDEGGLSIKDFCALFDSAYVSFYKGLGAITGAMLLGSKDFIGNARVWSRRFGGNLYCQLPYVISCRDGIRNTPLSAFLQRRNRLREVVAAVSAALGPEARVTFDPAVPAVSLIHVRLRGSVQEGMEALQRVREATGIQCLARLRPVVYGVGSCPFSYAEFNMGPANLDIPLDDWVRGYRALDIELQKVA